MFILEPSLQTGDPSYRSNFTNLQLGPARRQERLYRRHRRRISTNDPEETPPRLPRTGFSYWETAS